MMMRCILQHTDDQKFKLDVNLPQCTTESQSAVKLRCGERDAKKMFEQRRIFDKYVKERKKRRQQKNASRCVGRDATELSLYYYLLLCYPCLSFVRSNRPKSEENQILILTARHSGILRYCSTHKRRRKKMSRN